MNKQRFLVVAIVIVVVVLIVGITWVYVYSPQAPETCSPFREEVLAIGFKGDAIVFGLLGAIVAAFLYYFMLRHQIFFPATDAKRFFSATLGSTLLALLLTLIDSLRGPDCLKKALGPGSAIPESLSFIRSFAGLFVGNVWLAMALDQFLLAIAFAGVVKLWRETSWRYF